MEGALKLVTLAVRIAIAWTVLSLLLATFWWLLLEVGRRFGTRSVSKHSAREERRLSAEVRAIYAGFADVNGAGGDAPAHSDPDETEQSDALVFMGRIPVQKR